MVLVGDAVPVMVDQQTEVVGCGDCGVSPTDGVDARVRAVSREVSAVGLGRSPPALAQAQEVLPLGVEVRSEGE